MSTATKNDNSNNAPNAHSGSGYLEISEKGFGFLRTSENHFHPKPTDIFVTPDTIKRSFLREGAWSKGRRSPRIEVTAPN
jgi:transcription termination factor Rho